jgi:murein DD-endopeptidase MepM/ murein hydrolase activator NlpD
VNKKYILSVFLLLFVFFIFSQAGEKEPKTNIPALWPFNGIIDKGFGQYIDPATGEKKFNKGIYIWSENGDRVRASADGYVKGIQQSDEGRYQVVIDHGNGNFSRYGNLDRIKVKEKEYVKMGHTIGFAGKSEGGLIIYFEIQMGTEFVDPLEYILKIGKKQEEEK